MSMFADVQQTFDTGCTADIHFWTAELASPKLDVKIDKEKVTPLFN